MTKTALKTAMQHEVDAITLLTEDHKKVKKAKVDTAALGTASTQRKHELQAEGGEGVKLIKNDIQLK